MNFLIFFRLFCKTAVVGMEPVIIDPLALALLRVWLLCSYKETYARKEKKHIRGRLTVDEDKTRARMRVSVILVDHFGGKNYSGNRGTTQRFYMFRIFCTDVVVAGQFYNQFYMKVSFC